MQIKYQMALFAIVGTFVMQSISIPMIILGIFAISDYFLGMLASIKTGKVFKLSTAIWGAVKKLCYGLVILLAILIDLLITNTLGGMGIALPFKPIFSTIVTIYLCGIELASCFRNSAMIGVPIPKFLMTFAKFLQVTTEKMIPSEVEGVTADDPEKTEDEGNDQ